jgi:hypothetical protein
MAAPKLVTSRYLPPGAYIGQLIIPRAGNLAGDARVCNYVGRGSRLASGKNLAIRRSFVFAEALTLPTSAPFETTLAFPADGAKSSPVRIFDSITGIELREDQWSFVKVSGQFTKVVITPSAVDPAASYKIDYQSTSRDIEDPLPVRELRVIKAMGATQDRAQYKDFTDFFVPFSFAGPTAKAGNSVAAPFITSVLADSGNTGGSSVGIAPAASYTHNYNRFYELEVTAVSGSSGSFEATFKWKAVRYSGGKNALPATPIHTTIAQPTFTAQEDVASTLTPTLELGVVPQITFAGTNFAVGDKFYFNAVGPGLLEWDGRLSNTNQYLSFGTVVKTASVGSTGTLAYASDNDYTGTYNIKFRLQVTAVAGSVGSRTATFAWSQYGEIIGATGLSVASEASGGALSLTQGVKLTATFGASQFVVGDVFDFEVKAPRVFYQAKDNRVFKLSVSTATNPGADSGTVTGSYSTGTPEGGFGSWTAMTNLLTGSNAKHGDYQLPDNLTFFVRNGMRGNVNGTSYTNGDSYTGAVTSNEKINWSLTSAAEEIRETSSFLTDVTGAVTGTAGSIYVILDNVYDTGSVTAVVADTSAAVSVTEKVGTRFLVLDPTIPTSTIRVNYRYRGEEPSPGQLYYLTANYLRGPELFNTPSLILDREEGRTLLAPAETSNHLYIMNELAFANGAPGAYYTQVKDADGDGVLTTVDVGEALAAHEKVTRITDLCVLSHFDSLGLAMSVNEKGNDPFEKREQMLWVGAPIGTPIGDIDTPDSLVYLARTTLQVPTTSPALGTRVLLAPTEAKVSITLDNLLTQQVTVDGSFVAGATSALVNSFQDPATTVLRQNLFGFDTIQTYSEPQNLLLGGASITYLSQVGTGIYRFEEDVTVHTLDDEFQLISATVQKQFVTRVVRRELDAQSVAVVLPSPQASVAFIRSNLSGILTGLLGRGLLAPYQDDDGNERPFDPESDVLVFRDTASKVRYNFIYVYFIRFPIKQLLGLYSTSNLNFAA